MGGKFQKFILNVNLKWTGNIVRRLIWEDNIRIDNETVGSENVDWIHIARYNVHWWTATCTVLKLRVHKGQENYWPAEGFSCSQEWLMYLEWTKSMRQSPWESILHSFTKFRSFCAPRRSITVLIKITHRVREAVFLRPGVVRPRPSPTLEDHPLSVVLHCLFNIFSAVSSIRNQRPRHVMVTGTHLTWDGFKVKYLWILNVTYY